MTRSGIALCLVFALAACATPDVDRRFAAFDEADFEADLMLCRGGNVMLATARTVGLTILGSFYGAAEGAIYGVHKSDTAESAAIGAVIGGGIGLAAGGLSALENHEADIAACLAEKGYQIARTAASGFDPPDFSRQRLRRR